MAKKKEEERFEKVEQEVLGLLGRQGYHMLSMCFSTFMLLCALVPLPHLANDNDGLWGHWVSRQ